MIRRSSEANVNARTRVDADARFLGIDMGGTNIRASILDARGAILQSHTRSLPDGAAGRREAPAVLVREFGGDVDAIGMAVAGTVRAGVLTWSANLDLHDVPYRDLLEDLSGRPVVVLNDARAAGFAEASVGAGAGGRVVLTVTVGTGIGGAIVVGGALLEGTGDAGEIGHMVVSPDGPACSCGRAGCWELFVSGKALARLAASLYPESRDPLEVWLRALEAGEASATAVLGERCRLFGLGLDNLAAVINPDVIVLGGGVMAKDGVVARAYRQAVGDLRWGARTRIVASTLGDSAGQIGAGLAAARHWSQF